MTGYRDLIEQCAAQHGIDPSLVEAIVIRESAGTPWAWNPEPQYRYLWNVMQHAPFRPLTMGERVSEAPPDDFPFIAGDRDQEWWAQQASWGLMQIMGAVAREHGFTGPYLSQLCDPMTNLTIGCDVLTKLIHWAGGNVRQALTAYNGGKGGLENVRAKAYANYVLKLYASVQRAHPTSPV